MKKLTFPRRSATRSAGRRHHLPIDARVTEELALIATQRLDAGPL